MGANPFLGVFFHWLGGLASGSFYVPYRGVKKWSWETYWLVGGIFAWILCPWTFALIMTKDLVGVLQQQTASTIWWTYFFGLLWGFGWTDFRFDGCVISGMLVLGMGIALGFYRAALGTLLPPVFKAFMPDLSRSAASIIEIAQSTSGQVTIAGVCICLLWHLRHCGTLAGLPPRNAKCLKIKKKEGIKESQFLKKESWSCDIFRGSH